MASSVAGLRSDRVLQSDSTWGETAIVCPFRSEGNRPIWEYPFKCKPRATTRRGAEYATNAPAPHENEHHRGRRMSHRVDTGFRVYQRPWISQYTRMES